MRGRLGLLAPGSGFVFNTMHNTLPEAPAENTLAMLEALAEYDADA